MVGSSVAVGMLLLGAIAVLIWLISRLQVSSQDIMTRPGRAMHSVRFGIRGKPDVVIRRRGFYIPVEHKSSESLGSARDWDVAQLLAYCLIVEERLGRVEEGELVYRDATFVIPWNTENRNYILSVIECMRAGRGQKTRQHWKCRRCEFSLFCGRS